MKTLFLAVLAVVIFYTLADINIQSHEAVNIELSLAWSQRVIGGVIAAASGIMLMVRVGQKESLAQLAPLVVSALIGVLIAKRQLGSGNRVRIDRRHSGRERMDRTAGLAPPSPAPPSTSASRSSRRPLGQTAEDIEWPSRA